MTAKQYWVLGLVAALSTFIGVGIVLLITSGDGDDTVQVGPSTSSSGGTVATTTLPPTVATSTSTTLAPPVTQGTITPGTTVIVPPSTTATTAAPVTTTRPPASTTTRAPATTTTTTTTKPDRATDVGITDNLIRLAVIADRAETVQGLEAWQARVNRRRGLAGRRLEFDVLETGGTAAGYAAAVATACDEDFAIVGGFSVFDGAVETLGCPDIPDLPVEAIDTGRATSGNTFAAFPRQPDIVPIGPYAWLRDNVSGCCAQFVLVPESGPLRDPARSTIDALEASGFTTTGTPDVALGDDAPRYAALVDEIEGNGTTFAWSGFGARSTILLRQAAAGRAPDVVAWYCGSACYDPGFLADGAPDVNGQYVGIETVLFSDRSESSGLRSYLRMTERTGGDPSYEGLRAYTAGLLFEAAARRVIGDEGDNGLTRARLFAALAEIHEFTAGGIVGPTDVATGTPSGCFVLAQVVDGEYQRVSPTDTGLLDCGEQNLVEL